MPDEEYLDTKATSLRYNIAEATLRYWRHTGVGPPSIKLGGLVRYRRSEVEAWIDAQAAQARGEELKAAGQ